MGKKKEPTIQDALNIFNNVMQRASLLNYYYVDNIIISKNKNYNTILTYIDHDLWKCVIENNAKDSNNIEKLDLQSLNINNVNEYELSKIIPYAKDLNKREWVPIDMSSELFKGHILKIKMDNGIIPISINKDMMPVKLKKSEYENVSYCISDNPLMLIIKVDFNKQLNIEGACFSIIKLFQIL